MNTFERYQSTRQGLRRFLAGPVKISPSSDSAAIRATVLADGYLRNFTAGLYTKISARLALSPDFPSVELGAGVALGKEWLAGIISSDVVMNDYLDMEIDAQSIPFESESVSNLVLVNAFHHIPDVRRFLSEAERCLVPGGRIVLIDPYWGALATFVYKFLHPEPFSRRQQDWFEERSDRWDSNQALAWIVFVRDRVRFSQLFPKLKVLEIRPIGEIGYLLSGGVYGRTKLRSDPLKKIDIFFENLGPWWNSVRFFALIVIEKEG